MRLSMISWIIKTEVCVISRSRRLRQITQTRGFDNSWYHAKTEFNNCFIIHFHIIHPQKQKRSVQPFCFWGEHSKGLSNQTVDQLLQEMLSLPFRHIYFCHERTTMTSDTSENTIFVRFPFILSYQILTLKRRRISANGTAILFSK